MDKRCPKKILPIKSGSIFGSNIKQNMSDESNQTVLEKHW